MLLAQEPGAHAREKAVAVPAGTTRDTPGALLIIILLRLDTESFFDLTMEEVNLHEYEGQLEALSQLLLEDPDNQELQTLYDELAEVNFICTSLYLWCAKHEPVCESVRLAHLQVIKLSKELQHQQSTAPNQRPEEAAPCAPVPTTASDGPPTAALLPAPLLDQVRRAQERAALAGHGPAEWAIGAHCLALYGDDGNW